MRPLFMTFLLLCGLTALPVRAFDEGIDYQTLAQVQPTQSGNAIEVLELFWYGCPHCFQLEPTLTSWLATKPQNVVFRRMPAVLGPSWENHAKAYYAAEALGVLDRIHEALFSALHLQKKPIGDEESLANFFAEQGVNREEFLKAYRSFAVDMKVRQSKQVANRYGIDGVPAVIVNGRYRTSPTMTASRERMIEVLNHLIATEQKRLTP